MRKRNLLQVLKKEGAKAGYSSACYALLLYIVAMVLSLLSLPSNTETVGIIIIDDIVVSAIFGILCFAIILLKGSDSDKK